MKALRNKNGMAYVLTCVIVLVAMMMVSVLFQYRCVYSVINTQRDAAQTQLDSVVMKSAVEMRGGNPGDWKADCAMEKGYRQLIVKSKSRVVRQVLDKVR